ILFSNKDVGNPRQEDEFHRKNDADQPRHSHREAGISRVIAGSAHGLICEACFEDRLILRRQGSFRDRWAWWDPIECRRSSAIGPTSPDTWFRRAPRRPRPKTSPPARLRRLTSGIILSSSDEDGSARQRPRTTGPQWLTSIGRPSLNLVLLTAQAPPG